jgi:hypothetical protein
MITRATFALGLVWLCLPHNPDLGLPDAAAKGCNAAVTCARPADLERDAILKRLGEIRIEIRDLEKARAQADFGVVGRAERGSAESGSPFIYGS